MALMKTKTGCRIITRLPGDPIYFMAPKHRITRERHERVPKVYPTFPPIDPHDFNGYHFRLAALEDLDDIVELVDRLLSGRDFFCPRGQHLGYFKYKTIVLSFDGSQLIGWAVRQRNGSLIHLLVETTYRGAGIGTHLLKILDPLFIRSKFDQSTGDPLPFYEKHGYHKTSDERIGKHKNIDLLEKTCG